jgi:hypothetical protein
MSRGAAALGLEPGPTDCSEPYLPGMIDTSELGSTWTEICAYGTAVRARQP